MWKSTPHSPRFCLCLHYQFLFSRNWGYIKCAARSAGCESHFQTCMPRLNFTVNRWQRVTAVSRLHVIRSGVGKGNEVRIVNTQYWTHEVFIGKVTFSFHYPVSIAQTPTPAGRCLCSPRAKRPDNTAIQYIISNSIISLRPRKDLNFGIVNTTWRAPPHIALWFTFQRFV